MPIKIDENAFATIFSQPYFDSSGNPAGADDFRIEGRLVGNLLMIDLQSDDYRHRFELRRVSTRFGLDVADPPVENED